MNIHNPDDRYLGWRPEGPRRLLPQLELREVGREDRLIGGPNPRPTAFDGSDALAAINGRARVQPAPAPTHSKRRAKRPQPAALLSVRFSPISRLDLQVQHSTDENNQK
jgi:hypothetical protein